MCLGFDVRKFPFLFVAARCSDMIGFSSQSVFQFLVSAYLELVLLHGFSLVFALLT